MHNEIEYVFNLLENHRLKEALVQIHAMASQCSSWQLRTDVETLQTTYDLMLQYNAKGIKDPKQKDMYNKIFRSAYEMAERTHIMKNSTSSFALYYDLIRTYEHAKPHTLSELQMQLEAYTEDAATAPLIYSDANRCKSELAGIRERHEKALNELFERTWVSLYWTEAEAQEAQTLLNSLLVPVNDLCVFISAVTMSQSRIFDIRKYMLLLEAYNHPDPMVNQRAIVGIVITALFHEHRIMMYPEARAKLSLLNEDADFIKNLHTIQIQLQLSRETQKIDRKMREEIIPEMMKNPKLNLEGLDEDAEDHNPEWEEWIDRSGITDKLRELGELQMSGADVYMSTFSQLKQFPFFRKISHWFYPFDPQYQDIAKLSLGNDEQKISLLNILMNSDVFCNSDKYSFCFTMLQMPESQRNLMQQQLNGQHEASEELKERLKEMSQSKARAEFVSRQYIHDLYRFFKLWSRRHEIHDIFEDTLDLWNKEALSQALLHKEYINKLADYLFTHDDLAEAGILYDKSIELYNRKNAELWQKAGFIYQKIGSYKKAIDYYLQSDLLIPDNTWNNRHLAQCYRKEGNYPKALEYYNKVEQAQPDSLNLALQIGQCLMALERYDEALAYFFKVEYLDKKPQNARRAIGWCSFITGNHQQAKKYYDLLISEPKPIMEDWMNAGHVYYILNETEKSIEYYRKAQELCDSHDEFIRLYQIDKKDLIKQGANEVDLFILPDELI